MLQLLINANANNTRKLFLQSDTEYIGSNMHMQKFPKKLSAGGGGGGGDNE
jgi:hypothetical protein